MLRSNAMRKVTGSFLKCRTVSQTVFPAIQSTQSFRVFNVPQARHFSIAQPTSVGEEHSRHFDLDGFFGETTEQSQKDDDDEEGEVISYEEAIMGNEHIDEYGRIYSTGKRKTSVARVWIKEGSGQFLVNGKRITDYFQQHPREYAISPFLASRTAGFFDVWCTVKGGGTLGQAGAIRLGISKALGLWDRNLKGSLRRENMLFRDPRTVERKKPGQKKARKKYQWVKR